jgi:hypothetical protein
MDSKNQELFRCNININKINIIYLFALQPKINASNVVGKVFITFNIVLRKFVVK